MVKRCVQNVNTAERSCGKRANHVKLKTITSWIGGKKNIDTTLPSRIEGCTITLGSKTPNLLNVLKNEVIEEIVSNIIKQEEGLSK